LTGSVERGAPDEAGPAANERLTATTAVVLIVLLFVEGVTILFLRPLLPVHIFVGMLLIPPVALKLGSTGYRFIRYYSGAPAYVRRGPPHIVMRVLAPLLVAATVGIFSTGIGLLGLGPSRGRGIVLGLHKASFVVWFAVATVHVLGYLARLPRLVLRPGDVLPRVAVVTASLAVGLTLAAGTISMASPWVDHDGRHHDDDRSAGYFSSLR
jgi:hypothetical protein